MKTIKVPAIRYNQGGHTLYSFVVDGKLIPEFAGVDHLERDGDEIVGFQRPEVAEHIRKIQHYVDSPSPMIPNSIVVGFRKPLKFEPVDRGSDVGHLTLPCPAKGEKAALIVDGQQRHAAIREAKVASFPMSVVAFVAEGEEEMKEHFIRVNNQKPLPKGMLLELLPGIEAEITSELEKRKLPALLMDRLNRDEDSPMRGKIRTATNPSGVIKDNTLIRAIEDGLTNGYLYHLRVSETPAEDMLKVLKAFWNAVVDVFPEAWELPPRESRLTHAAGIIGLTALMSDIADDDPVAKLTRARFRRCIELVAPACHWTEGDWNFGPDGRRPWNAVENTTRGIALVANLLKREYRKKLTKGEAA